MSGLFKLIDRNPGLVTAFSQKSDGPMGLSTRQNIENKRNRELFFKKNNIDQTRIVQAKLKHGTDVWTVTKPGSVEADGLLTDVQNLYLIITAADCLPIFLSDPEKHVIGLIHAGWRGLASGIVLNALDVIKTTYGSSPDQLKVGIGPGIGVCHYSAKPGAVGHFSKFKSNVVVERDGKKFIDLRAAAVEQLLNRGVSAAKIEVNNECTYELEDKYFSWRREQPGELRTMVAVFGMR